MNENNIHKKKIEKRRGKNLFSAKMGNDKRKISISSHHTTHKIEHTEFK